MKLVLPSHETLTVIDRVAILQTIEKIGRTCYKSEALITEVSAVAFVQSLMERGHESVIEHVHLTVRFVCDRGVSHELVRHRLASYSQESTRYCNYGKHEDGVTFIEPFFWTGKKEREDWYVAMKKAEDTYLNMVGQGVLPQEARSVLPNSLKTEIVMTANLREWRHVFRLRCSDKAHPQMREVMCPVRDEFKAALPEIFGGV